MYTCVISCMSLSSRCQCIYNNNINGILKMNHFAFWFFSSFFRIGSCKQFYYGVSLSFSRFHDTCIIWIFSPLYYSTENLSAQEIEVSVLSARVCYIYSVRSFYFILTIVHEIFLVKQLVFFRLMMPNFVFQNSFCGLRKYQFIFIQSL